MSESVQAGAIAAPAAGSERARTVPAFCRLGHRLDAANLRVTSKGVRYCRICRSGADRERKLRRFAQRHAGHDVLTDRNGHRYCRTCIRGEHVLDAMVVERLVAGDRPERVRAAELEAAVVQLRLSGLSGALVAERVGYSPRHVWRIFARVGLTARRGEAA